MTDEERGSRSPCDDLTLEDRFAVRKQCHESQSDNESLQEINGFQEEHLPLKTHNTFDQTIENFHESNISSDSWGDFGNDKETCLTELSKMSLNVSSNRESPRTTKSSPLLDHRQQRVSPSSTERPGRRRHNQRRAGRFRDSNECDWSSGSSNSRTAISDDGMDYFAALAPQDEVIKSRIETRISFSSVKQRSKSLEMDAPIQPSFMVARDGSPLTDWCFSVSDGSDNDNDSVSAPTFSTPPDRQSPRMSLYSEHLIESLAWFSFHTPKCVLDNLTSIELKNCIQGQHDLLDEGRAPSSPIDSDGHDSLSSLSDDDGKSSNSGRHPKQDQVSQVNHITEIAMPAELSDSLLNMPFTTKRECALVFVDISGFTKLSTILDVESLSKVINTYFRLLVDEVNKYGGDILKFAGDAFFAEWRVVTSDEIEAEQIQKLQKHPLTNLRARLLEFRASGDDITEARSIAECVLAASQCAASIVRQFSDFRLQASRELSISFRNDQQGKGDNMLNVHCGIGCGALVGVHVGDNVVSDDCILETRREFLFLGDPIRQVSLAESMASEGEVYASSQAFRVLRETCSVPQELLLIDGPLCIASRANTFFTPVVTVKSFTSTVASKEMTSKYLDSLSNNCASLEPQMLERLHRQLSFYVHHVVRDNELDVRASQHGIRTMRASFSFNDRHIAEAELRLVYTMFINANIDSTLTSDPAKDAVLFNKLQRIMHVTCRELHRYSGHLRQFIVDDKGVVLIGTFGLRGSTFANMVPHHALPATFAIHSALMNEIGVGNRIGATLGKVYCGVVGGVLRHEFSVMGAPVNLAARLMHSKINNGILVDEAVQAHADLKYAFKRLHPVEAKGYDKAVIIFEPLHVVNNKKRGFAQGFVGRQEEVAQLTGAAQSILADPDNMSTVMAFIIGEPGIGKTAIGLRVIDEMKHFANIHQQKIFFHRSTSTETEKRVPLSSFRRIFLCGISERCIMDGSFISSHDEKENRRAPSQRKLVQAERRASLRHLSGPPPRRASIGRTAPKCLPSTRRLQRSDSSHSLTSIRSIRSGNLPYLKQLYNVCGELGYPHEYAEIVGSQWLGLENCTLRTHVDGRIPSIDELVTFLASAYMRLTEFAHLTIIFLDDFQWIDSLTWKVIRVLCEEGKNILIMGAMRSQETQALRRMSSVASWHSQMQARKGILEVNVGPLESIEVRSLIARVFDYDVDIIDDDLSFEIYQKTGGITMYVIELLEDIKRNQRVAVDKDSGKLKWTPQAEKEQQRIGSNNIAGIELSFLNRFDSLDRGVRRVLQTCAVLGMSFALGDVLRFHPEMDELVLELSLNAAVDELILTEDIEDEEDDDKSYWSGRGSQWESRNLPPSYNASEDRFFRFGHAMWRKTVLDAMLSEHKVHMHRIIAEAMEIEQLSDLDKVDLGRFLTLFDHWKCCGDFGKAAPLALSVGLRLEEWDLAAQSLDLYRDALEMCYESAGIPVERARLQDENELWLPASAPPATVGFILRLYIRIAQCHADLGEHEQCLATFKDAYTIMTTSPKAAKLNGELALPILSGLCSIALERNGVHPDMNGSSEELVEKFLTEAKVRDDVVHIARALAMKASIFACLGKFDDAINVQESLQLVYDVTEHSKGIYNEYGKDYAAQSYAYSVQWYMLSGNQEMAEKQLDFVIERLLPHFDPRDIDTTLDLLFPGLLVLKSIGKAREAETVLFKYAINPFHDLGEFSTRWLSLFNPCAYLFQVLGMVEDNDFEIEILAQIQEWVLDPDKSIFTTELQRKGYALVGEICTLLASLKSERSEEFHALIDRGRMVLTRVVCATDIDNSDTFLVLQARLALDALGRLDDMSDDLLPIPGDLRDSVTIAHNTETSPERVAPRIDPGNADSKVLPARHGSDDSAQLITASKCCMLL